MGERTRKLDAQVSCFMGPALVRDAVRIDPLISSLRIPNTYTVAQVYNSVDRIGRRNQAILMRNARLLGYCRD